MYINGIIALLVGVQTKIEVTFKNDADSLCINKVRMHWPNYIRIIDGKKRRF